MALLDRNNTDFEESITRAWSPHYKSSALKNCVAAVKAFQDDNANAVKLGTAYQRLYDWISANPKEFAKRGSKVEALRREILQKAVQLGANLALIDAQFRRLNHVWKAIFLQDIRAKIGPHINTWRTIEITDQPTGVPGQYNFTVGNHYAEADRNQANLDTNEVQDNKQNHPNYWLRLGRRVVTAQVDNKRYGRCFSCAAAVIYSLVTDPSFDEYMIEHVGAIEYDHHLVLLDRANATGNSSNGLNDQRASWMSTAVVIDVWQGNLNGNTNYVDIAAGNQYAQANLRWFCAFPPNQRAADRAFAGGLPVPQRNVVNLDRIQEVRQAREQGIGEATRNRKVDGRWVVERQNGDGTWSRV